MKTALDQYERLESTGRWREHPHAPWREVLVSFGNATLLLSAFKDEAPLTHWSLAAVTRIAAAGDTVTYAPAGALSGADAEVLEISDAMMIEAIETVTATARINAVAPPPRRMRRPLQMLGVAVLVLVVAIAVARGPALLRIWALALVSAEQTVLMSEDVRGVLATPACRSRDGARALDVVLRRIGTDPARVALMPWSGPALAALPDGTLLIARGAVEQASGAAALAGWILLGQAQGERLSPLRRWMHAQEPRRVLAFLTHGEISAEDARAMADLVLAGAPQPQPHHVAAAMSGLAALDLSSDTFASQLGAAYPALDLPETGPPGPALLPGDRDWVALQNICQ